MPTWLGSVIVIGFICMIAIGFICMILTAFITPLAANLRRRQR